MRNNAYGDDHIAFRRAAIFEALLIDRATVVSQTGSHPGASVLFEEIKRFNGVRNADAAVSRESMVLRSGETPRGIRTGGVTWDTH
ncbi:MAG TPA: hypothetical protein VGO08_11085 [Burkholderiales bacterium]|nr:hypothetical protein [Burkholderiales bacterium]